jgi:hypothetical protein
MHANTSSKILGFGDSTGQEQLQHRAWKNYYLTVSEADAVVIGQSRCSIAADRGRREVTANSHY